MSQRDGGPAGVLSQLEQVVLEHMPPPGSEVERPVLPERLDRLLEILGVLGAFVCEFDVKGRLLYASPNAEQILGFTPEQLLAAGLEFHPEDLPSVVEAGRVVRTTGEVARNEARVRHKDGHWVWAETSLLGWRATPGDAFHTVAVSRDVSELKRAKAARAEIEARYRAVSEMSSDLIFEVDAKGRQTYIGPGSEEIIGYTAEEALTLEPWSRIHPDDVKRIREQLETEFHEPGQEDVAGDVRSRRRLMEYRLRHRDGHWLWFETLGLTYQRADGETRFLAVSRDVTARRLGELKRRELEDSMQRAQKLESLGVLAGGIAHDFNNILTPIMGAASLALRDLPDESPVCAHLERIQRAVERAATLTNQMLAYAGQKPMHVASVDVSRLVREMSELIASSISGENPFDLLLAPDLPAVNGEAAQLGQVVMNLVTNAAEALEIGVGEIHIRTGTVTVDRPPPGAMFAETMVPGPHVYLEVADEGCGMDAATRERIFDPFYTTKFTGRGLGLAAVAGIVRAHRGAISVESELGRGTRFRVLLPSAAIPVAGPTPKRHSGEDWRATGTALVIDDDEAVRELAEDVIRRSGMTVLTAADGHEGVKVFKQHADSIRIVLLDRTMPTLSGADTWTAIRDIRPDTKIILVSGYSEEWVMAELEAQGLAGFLTKPFQPEALLAAIRSALEGSSTLDVQVSGSESRLDPPAAPTPSSPRPRRVKGSRR